MKTYAQLSAALKEAMRQYALALANHLGADTLAHVLIMQDTSNYVIYDDLVTDPACEFIEEVQRGRHSSYKAESKVTRAEIVSTLRDYELQLCDDIGDWMGEYPNDAADLISEALDNLFSQRRPRQRRQRQSRKAAGYPPAVRKALGEVKQAMWEVARRYNEFHA